LRRRFHQPEPGPPRLPRHHGRLLRRQAQAFQRRPALAGGRQPGRSWGAKLISRLSGSPIRVVPFALEDAGTSCWTRGSLVHVVRQADGDQDGGRFNIGNALAAATTARELEPTGTPSPPALPAWSRYGAVSGGRRGPTLSGAGRLRPHAGGAERGPQSGPRTNRPFASSRSRPRPHRLRCGGDRDRAKRRRWERWQARWRTWRSSHPITLAARNLWPLSNKSRVGRGCSALTDLDRGEAVRRALAMAREGDVVLIAGKGTRRVRTSGTTSNHSMMSRSLAWL